jgi:hypothetical protein
MLLGQSFDEITAKTLQALIDAGATESARLDFKQKSYGSSDDEKKELLKDVSSFANTLGGYLVVGVAESEGVAKKLSPLNDLDADKELLRLENICRTGIEPPISGLRMKRLDVAEGVLFLVMVPRSFNPPHRVTFRNSNRFYARNSAGVHELSLEELRALFGQKRRIEKKARSFVSERINRLRHNEGFAPLPVSKGILLIHLIPLQDFGLGRQIDVATICRNLSPFSPIHSSGYSRLINLDGCCLYHGNDPSFGYTQIFRDGTVEATIADLVFETAGERRISALSIMNYTHEALSNYIPAMKELGASPPILVHLSALEVFQTRLAVEQKFSYREGSKYGQSDIRLPPSVIEEFRTGGDHDDILFEQMSYFWNAFGYERCFYFDAEGNILKR